MSEIIGTWDVPLKGIVRIPPHRLPPDALWESQNVVVRDVTLQVRPGMGTFTPDSFAGIPTGAISLPVISTAVSGFQADAFQPNAFQANTSIADHAIVVGTTTAIYSYTGGTWHNITLSSLTAGENQPVRFTQIQIAGTIFLVGTNGVDPPFQWDSLDSAVALVSAGAGPAPGNWTDVCTTSDRIVGLLPPYNVVWGNNLKLDEWPALNFRALSDTTDKVVAIRNFGTLGAVVYKERSIWLATPGGATDASYFRFDLKGFYEGPSGPAAVVDVDGSHYYMTSTGRIGNFTGYQHSWVADGVWPLVRAELDHAAEPRTFGVYHPLRNEVWFSYPRVGDGGACKGLVILVLPSPAQGVTEPIAFWGVWAAAPSAGCDHRIGTNEAIFFTRSPAKAYRLTDLSGDAGTDFPGYWQSGLVAAEGLDHYRVEAIQLWAERGLDYGSLRVRVLGSFSLQELASLDGPEVAVNLAQTQVRERLSQDVRGQFFGLRFMFDKPVNLQVHGARMEARKIDRGV